MGNSSVDFCDIARIPATTVSPASPLARSFTIGGLRFILADLRPPRALLLPTPKPSSLPFMLLPGPP